MGKLFGFFGGRRQVSVFFTGAVALVAEHLLPAEGAARVTEVVGWVAGVFIGGESVADAAGRLKK